MEIAFSIELPLLGSESVWNKPGFISFSLLLLLNLTSVCVLALALGLALANSFAIAITCLVGILFCHHQISLHPSACPDSRLTTQDMVQIRICFQTQKQNQFHQRYLNLRMVPHNWN